MGTKNFAVILAGGKGERFWPLSNSRQPKQFLSLVGEKTLLAQAVDRLEGLIPPERVYVITNGELVEAARAAAPALPAENIIGEPMGRDTAAAIALGAALVKKQDPGAAFTVLTADHIIGDLEVFRQTISDGLALALEQDVLVTIGISPDSPSTGYGYIEAGGLLVKTEPGTEFFSAQRFVEKPDKPTAEEYVAAGNYMWNSGMFIWSAKAIETAFGKHRAPLKTLMDTLEPVVGTSEFDGVLKAEYEKLEKISIDYAVMEKADNVVTAKGTFAWDDVGAWPAIENHFEANGQGNVVIGKGESLDAAGNIVVSRDRLTALIGVQDLVVVQAEGVTLICPKKRAQDVKKLVHQLKEKGTYGDVL
jgi:mannose-1-phosphate guanylyltransferase